MATILDTLKKGTEYLQKYGVDEARLNMEHLIAHVLEVERMQLYLDFDRPLDEPALESLRDLTKRRSRGEPLQHLLGTVEFLDNEFKTDGRALIPRPETEELASILSGRSWPEGISILDMGCGSGVIGLSLAKAMSDRNPSLFLADVSADALTLAQENSDSLDTSTTLIESDLFSAVDGKFDLIVANLPYIPNAEETTLSREVQNDPALALYGGELGTEVIERFLKEAPNYLNPSGSIALEFGIDQAARLRQCAGDSGFSNIEIQSDLSGIERFLFASISGENC